MHRSNKTRYSEPVTGGRGTSNSVKRNSLALDFSSKRGINSGSGGGPSGRASGATPTSVAKSTPPTTPSRGEVAETPGETDAEDVLTPFSPVSFSSKTCIELLPYMTEEQLEFEIKHLNISTQAKKRDNIINVLKKRLNNESVVDFKNCVENASNILSSFHCLVKRAEESVEKLCSPRPPVTETPAPAPVPPEAETVSVPPSTATLDSSVCDVCDDILFSDVLIDDVINQLTIDTQVSHGRKTTYFGNTPYSYGRIRHEPQPYPDCQFFDTLFTGLQSLDPDITRDNYTCLVTLYPDGSSQIPLHSDNEGQIALDSTIYTVSIGSDRTLVLQNQYGLINETRIPIKNGSVYSMSAASQASWKHGIEADRAVTEPRVSFGFRRLIPVTELAPKPRAPPIVHPDEFRSPEAVPIGTHERCLLLTDSIISATPPGIFNRIENVRCIKKVNKRLVDVFNFEPEFGICSTVVLSAGVNDLSCYGLRAHVLADMVVNRLRDTCRKHMKTEFIYNSILHTTHDWLNVEIDIFNKIMYELSFNIPNLLFFDSHGVLQQHPISRSLHNIIDRNDTRGEHITADARRLITENLVSAVEFTINRARGTAMPTRLNNWYWPIRQSFTDRNPSPPHFTHRSHEQHQPPIRQSFTDRNPSPPHFTHGSHEHYQPHFERETFIPYHRRSVYR